MQGTILTKVYRRALTKCGRNTKFGAGVYIVYPNRVQIGKNCYIGPGTCFTSEFPPGHLTIGDHVQISNEVMIDFTGGITIKKNTLISARARIMSHGHGYDPHSEPDGYELTIEEDAWIGFNAIILPGVERIGKGAVIGAGSVVTKPVPDWAVIAGNPAKVIKIRDRIRQEVELNATKIGPT